MKPTNLSELYPSEWLNHSDLNGRSFVLTISGVAIRKFKQSLEPDEWRAVLSFEKADKKLICNKTQATAVSEIAQSENFTDWPGTRITLSPGTAKNKKPTIIVRPAPVPRPEPVAPTATNTDNSQPSTADTAASSDAAPKPVSRIKNRAGSDLPADYTTDDANDDLF